MLLLAGGMLWYSQIPVHGSYGSDLLPGYLLVGFGLAVRVHPGLDRRARRRRAARGRPRVGDDQHSQQIGGAIGVAIAISVATTHRSTC